MSESAPEPANKIRIGLKYCGGCKPEYDRVQAVRSIGEQLKQSVEIVSYEDPDAQGTLVIAGCATACVDMSVFAGRPIWIVAGARGAEEFFESFRQGKIFAEIHNDEKTGFILQGSTSGGKFNRD